MQALPPRIRVKMAYSLTEPISSHATLNLLGTTITYTLNSIFAPGGGAGAHQPYNRDTFFAQFNKYKVHATHVRITSGPEPDANKSFIVTQVGPPNVTVTAAGVAVGPVRERYDGRFKPTFVMNSTHEARETVRDIQMYHACGITKSAFEADMDTYAAAMGNDPTNKVYLYVNLGCSTASSYSTYVQTYMEFDVELFERLVVSTS